MFCAYITLKRFFGVIFGKRLDPLYGFYDTLKSYWALSGSLIN